MTITTEATNTNTTYCRRCGAALIDDPRPGPGWLRCPKEEDSDTHPPPVRGPLWAALLAAQLRRMG